MTEKLERPDIELARAWCGIILDNPAARDHFVSDNAAMAYFEKLRALKTICDYALNLESSKAESALARKSNRAWVEAMVRATYEDAAKIADQHAKMSDDSGGDGWREAAIATCIRAKIRELPISVDEGSGCVFCDCEIPKVGDAHAGPLGQIVNCTNRARANGDKSP